MDQSSFGDRLKHLRKKREMSQDELAELLGTSKQVISRYETSQRAPKITTVSEYANALQVPLGYLLGEDENDSKLESNDGHNEELSEYLESLHKRPEMKMLFSVAKNATKAEIEQVVKMIETFKKDSE